MEIAYVYRSTLVCLPLSFRTVVCSSLHVWRRCSYFSETGICLYILFYVPYLCLYFFGCGEWRVPSKTWPPTSVGSCLRWCLLEVRIPDVGIGVCGGPLRPPNLSEMGFLPEFCSFVLFAFVSCSFWAKEGCHWWLCCLLAPTPPPTHTCVDGGRMWDFTPFFGLPIT